MGEVHPNESLVYFLFFYSGTFRWWETDWGNNGVCLCVSLGACVNSGVWVAEVKMLPLSLLVLKRYHRERSWLWQVGVRPTLTLRALLAGLGLLRGEENKDELSECPRPGFHKCWERQQILGSKKFWETDKTLFSIARFHPAFTLLPCVTTYSVVFSKMMTAYPPTIYFSKYLENLEYQRA